jgi:hypothetical protein
MSDESTFQPADAQTLRARGYASDFVAAFLTMLEKSKPSMRDGSDFPFEDEALRMYLTLIELGKRAEIQADKAGIEAGAARRFYCPDYIAELHYRRATQSFDLTPELKEKERRKLARAWRERFKRVIHARQCRNHFAFVERERREKRDKRQATVYTDRLTDLLSDAAQLIREKRGVQVKRAALAVCEVLARFAQKEENIYAPEWVEAEEIAPDEETGDAADATTADETDPFEAVRKQLSGAVRAARSLVAARSLTEDEADKVRDELHALIETEWTAAPRPDGAPRKRSAVVRSPVLIKRDIPENLAPWLDEIVTPPAPANGHLVVRSNVPLNSDASQFFAGNLALAPERGFPNMECPAEAARLTVEAMQSVGADKFKVVYLGSVPVGGQAECVGSEEIAPAALLGRVGELVARSETRGQSVTLRAWGGRLVQVDDCTRDVMRRLLPFAFLAVETSPENFQTWLALSPDITDEARKDVRGRLLRKFAENGEGANGGAYNSLRLPGCLNAKEKYQKSLGSFPRVALTHVELGRTVAPLELEQAGLLAAPVEKPKPPIMPTSAKLPAGAMPDYNDHLAATGGDRSRADIRWSMAALGAGFPHYAVIAQLEAMSGKAQGRHDDYARKTVDNAASFVAASSVTKAGRERVTL